MVSDSVLVDTYLHVAEARCIFLVVLTGDSWVHCHVKAEWHKSTAGTASQSFLPFMCSKVCSGKSEASKLRSWALKVNQVGSLEPQDREAGSRDLFFLTEQEATAENGK